MKVKNIEWIVSDETEENSFRNDAEILASLPNEVELPVDLSLDDYDDEDEFYDAISEWLSDTYGYLHNGYDVAIIYSEEKPTEEIKIKLDSCSESSLLEDDINKFMSSHNIIDIKFSSTENSYDVAILYN